MFNSVKKKRTSIFIMSNCTKDLLTYYQQVFGTAMGSSVSAVIANMVMEDDILFLAMTVTTNISDRPNASLVHV